MNTLLLRVTLIPVLTIALFAIGNTAFAQGTATGPSTSHSVDPGLIVIIGDLASPIPIDLDPSGPPWTKGLFDNTGLSTSGGTLDIFETILNVGTEAWGDWHEHIIGDPASASFPSFWSNVSSLEVNGTPITFTYSITGADLKDLTIDNFSQPVLPGDILTINKQIEVSPNSSGADGTSLVRLLEYPTPAVIPEPSAALLMLLGTAVCTLARRRRQ